MVATAAAGVAASSSACRPPCGSGNGMLSQLSTQPQLPLPPDASTPASANQFDRLDHSGGGGDRGGGGHDGGGGGGSFSEELSVLLSDLGGTAEDALRDEFEELFDAVVARPPPWSGPDLVAVLARHWWDGSWPEGGGKGARRGLARRCCALQDALEMREWGRSRGGPGSGLALRCCVEDTLEMREWGCSRGWTRQRGWHAAVVWKIH
eukprot:366201-Chlamydomonas_euryale.AAC.9